jgi:predicted ATPase
MALHYNFGIRWKNYRAFADTGFVPLRPLTVIIGPNNSGKSSIVGPLILMNQTMSSRAATTPLLTRGPTLDVGEYRDFVHNHHRAQDVFFSFDFHTHEPKRRIAKIHSYAPGAVEMTLGAGKKPEDLILKSYALFDIFRRPMLRLSKTTGNTYRARIFGHGQLTAAEKRAIRETQPANFAFSPASTVRARHRRPQDSARSTQIKYSKQFTCYLNAVSSAFEELRRILGTMSYVGPLREKPLRYYPIPDDNPISVGTRGEDAAALLFRQLKSHQKSFNEWVRRFGFGDSIVVTKPEGGHFSVVFRSKTGIQTNIADAGFGASQVVPLIAQAILARPYSLTIAEQPEIHLNPRVQCELADLFVGMAKRDRRVVVETHSEHMLLRLRTLIARKVISSEDVALYFVEKQRTKASVRRISIGKNGHIDSQEWPQDFFAETLSESLSLAAAQQDNKS